MQPVRGEHREEERQHAHEVRRGVAQRSGARPAPRRRGGPPAAGGSGGRRARAWTTSRTCPTRSRRARRARCAGPGCAASSATPAPVMPPPMTSTSNCSSASRRTDAARSSGARPTGWRSGGRPAPGADRLATGPGYRPVTSSAEPPVGRRPWRPRAPPELGRQLAPAGTGLRLSSRSEVAGSRGRRRVGAVITGSHQADQPPPTATLTPAARMRPRVLHVRRAMRRIVASRGEGWLRIP